MITAGQAMTPADFLYYWERSWRDRMVAGSLAAELLDQTKAEDRDEALQALGKLYRRQTDSSDRTSLLVRWPAVHVLTTAGIAVDHWDGGFWPKLASLLRVTNTQTLHSDWGTAYLSNLQHLGLPTFDQGVADAGTRYVGRILMHSGMPTYCLRDYYRVIGERRSRVGGLEPDEFVSWAAARAAQDQLYGVDKPVARFLRYGEEFAVDVTDRVFDLLDAVAAGGDGSDVPLPQRFRQVALQMLSEGTVLAQRHGKGRSFGETDQRARLAIDPYGVGPLLRLPAVGETPDGSAVWLVELDGVTRRIATRPHLPGSDDPAPPTEVPIPSPVRSAAASLADRGDLQMTLAVVDDRDPLLAFDEDGLALPPGLALPGRRTWLLFPGETTDLQVSGEARELAESALPPGWSGWRLILVDLEGAASVSIGAAGRLRLVRHQAAAHVIVDEPVPGVRAATGLPVVSSVPSIELPQNLDSADWEVTLLDSAGRALSRWRTGEPGNPNVVWRAVPRPAVGTFTIRVRGPWGRGATRTVSLVEGLDVTFSPPWRHFVRGGLASARAELRAPSGIDLSRSVIQYSAQDCEVGVRVGAHGASRMLSVTPPHMSVAYQSTKHAPALSVQPARLHREDILAEPGTLIVDVGALAQPRLHALAPSGVIQIIDGPTVRAGICRFDLSRLVDTLRAEAQVQLALDDDGALSVAAIRPRRLFRDVKLDDGKIIFTECVDAEGLTAIVYATRAPWREPVSLSIERGQAVLPEHLVHAGSLRVIVRIEDPWVPLPILPWPEGGNTSLLPDNGHLRAGTDEETAVSAYLSGEGPLPTKITDFARLWTARGLLDQLGLGLRRQAIAEGLDRALYADPRTALLGLSASRAPGNAIPSLIITAGLAWANLEHAHEDEPPIWTMRSALPATLLSAADAEWSQDEVYAAIEVCGDVVADLLTGKDPFSTAGRLDASADIFDSRPEMRDEIVRKSGLVPAGLLSADSRVLAAMEYVKNRQDSRLSQLMRTAEELFTQAQRILNMLKDPIAEAAVAARRHPTSSRGWHIVPALSLAFALAARHAARGHELAAKWLGRKAGVWADLAGVVPSMVTIDIILAELLVTASSTGPNQTAE